MNDKKTINMRVAFLDSHTIELDDDIEYSELQDNFDFSRYPFTKSTETAGRLAGVDVVMTNKVPITREVMQNSTLKHIAVVATGVNNIDLSSAHDFGIPVSNVPGYAAHSVPQHIFALILNLATRVDRYSRDVQLGEWQSSETFTLLKYNTFELAGKTIGIIGFGSIGRATARIADAFGMRILMNRKSGLPAQGYSCSSLDDIYRHADVISLSCPLTDENRYMINRQVLTDMKQDAILINTARGPLVNQSDLAWALNEGIIAGAGIDVLDVEPPSNGNPLLKEVPNCIVTPHSAWSTREARQRLIDEVALNIRAFMRGEERNIVES